MKIPRGKLYISFYEILLSLFKVFLSIDLVSGKKVDKFNHLIKEYYNKKYCLSFSTARISFYYYLKSLDLDKGSEVLISPVQIPDFVNVIYTLGLKPVYVKLDKDSHSMDLDDLKNQITNKTKAILVTHYHGVIGEIENIKKICEDRSIFLIEDISHAYGSKIDNKLAGTFGNAAVGSLSPGKIVSSVGGGFLILNDSVNFNRIIKDTLNDYKKPKKIILYRIIFFQLLVSIVTSKFIFNNITYYLFLILNKIKTHKIKDNKDNKTYIKDNIETIYSNPVILRKIPNYFFYNFLDFQADIAIKSFNRNLLFGLEKRQNFVKTVIDNLNDEAKSLIPKKIFDHKNWAFWHFPIIIEKAYIDICKKFFFKNKIDIVGYGMIFCNKEKSFNNFYREDLDESQKIYESTLFLPIHDDFNFMDAKKIAQILNLYVKQLNNNEI